MANSVERFLSEHGVTGPLARDIRRFVRPLVESAPAESAPVVEPRPKPTTKKV